MNKKELEWSDFQFLDYSEIEKWWELDDLGKIRDFRGWQKCLEDHCAELKGHRVVWQKNVDP